MNIFCKYFYAITYLLQLNLPWNEVYIIFRYRNSFLICISLIRIVISNKYCKAFFITFNCVSKTRSSITSNIKYLFADFDIVHSIITFFWEVYYLLLILVLHRCKNMLFNMKKARLLLRKIILLWISIIMALFIFYDFFVKSKILSFICFFKCFVKWNYLGTYFYRLFNIISVYICNIFFIISRDTSSQFIGNYWRRRNARIDGIWSL